MRSCVHTASSLRRCRLLCFVRGKGHGTTRAFFAGLAAFRQGAGAAARGAAGHAAGALSMSSAVTSAPAPSGGAFGLEPGALQALRGFFDATEGLQRVWVFGSRARYDWRARSDLDLALDAPGWSAKDFLRIKERMKDLPIVYPLDVVHWQGVSTPEFVAQIERDLQLFWEPRRGVVSLPRTLGATDLKKFQDESLQKLDAFVSELRARKQESDD